MNHTKKIIQMIFIAMGLTTFTNNYSAPKRRTSAANEAEPSAKKTRNNSADEKQKDEKRKSESEDDMTDVAEVDVLDNTKKEQEEYEFELSSEDKPESIVKTTRLRLKSSDRVLIEKIVTFSKPSIAENDFGPLMGLELKNSDPHLLKLLLLHEEAYVRNGLAIGIKALKDKGLDTPKLEVILYGPSGTSWKKSFKD